MEFYPQPFFLSRTKSWDDVPGAQLDLTRPPPAINDAVV